MDNQVLLQKRFFPRKKVCKFCADPNLVIDYKKPEILKSFLNEKGMILHRRQTGTCAYHQRRLTEAIKRARIVALLPFVADVEID